MPNEFIHQRHAAYQTPQVLLFDLIRQATGDAPFRCQFCQPLVLWQDQLSGGLSSPLS